MKDKNQKAFTCTICQETIADEWGNNPWPIKEGKCCDSCDQSIVTKARLNPLKHQEKP